MENGMGALLILVIFFCSMVISYWLKELVISIRELKYKTNEQNRKINHELWLIKDELKQRL
jgi:hypothetical protein